MHIPSLHSVAKLGNATRTFLAMIDYQQPETEWAVGSAIDAVAGVGVTNLTGMLCNTNLSCRVNLCQSSTDSQSPCD